MKTNVTIHGTHCASCKALIEDVCKEIPGVISCDVDFKTGKTVIEHEANFDWKIFQNELTQLGKYQLIM